MTIGIRTLGGAELAAALDALADLRIEVFSEWPYLYDGDAAYEREYLGEFAGEEGSVLVAAMDGDRIVGAATASPMSGRKPEFRRLFDALGHDTSRLFYLGESVLLPAYRGKGIGHAFFDRREAAARAHGATHATFCAVVRSEDDFRRPPGHRPLDPFWRARGYEKVEGLTTSFDWKETGSAGEIAHTMQFWMAAL